MTDKEFKRLNRSQLIEIIYQFQIKVEELTRENQTLNAELEDRRLRVTQAGNIAEAALAVNHVMCAAQNAAEQYLEEIRILRSETDEACQNMRKKARDEADALTGQAKEEAAAILTQSQTEAATLLAQAKEEAAAILAQAQTEADAIAQSTPERKLTEAELAEILSQFEDFPGFDK